MKNSQKGFVAPLLIAVVTLLVIGSVYIYGNNKVKIPTAIDTGTQQSNQAQQQINDQTSSISAADCEKYTDSISRKINQYNASQKPELKNSDNTGENPQYDLYLNNKILKEVFYSPKINSCLYLESRKTLIKLGANAKSDIGNWSVAYETYYLIDALTSKEIPFYKGMSSIQIVSRGSQFHSEKEADDALSEYR